MKHRKVALTAPVVCISALLAAVLCAGELKAPPIGMALLANGELRALYGLPENVVVDSRGLGKFDAVSFSDQAGLVASGGRIQLVKPDLSVAGEADTTEQRPLLNVETDANSAVAWLPGTKTVLHWKGSGFTATPANGIPQSLQATAVRVAGNGNVELLLADAEQMVYQATIAMNSGQLVSLSVMPGMQGHAFWQGTTVLVDGDNGLQAIATDGTTRTLGVKAKDLQFARMSSNWVLVRSAATEQAWAIRVMGNDIEVSEMPGVGQ